MTIDTLWFGAVLLIVGYTADKLRKGSDQLKDVTSHLKSLDSKWSPSKVSYPTLGWPCQTMESSPCESEKN